MARQTGTAFTSESLEYESQLVGRIREAVSEIACQIATTRGDNVVVSNDMYWAAFRVIHRCAEDREFARRLLKM